MAPGGHKKKHRRRRKKVEKKCWWALPLTLTCIIVLFVLTILTITEVGNYQTFITMRSSVEAQSFYNGIVIENYDLTGVSLAEALEYWDRQIETPLREAGLVFQIGNDSLCVSAEELGYCSNYRQVIYNAWNRGRTGTLEERYRSVNQIRTVEERYSVERTLFDADMLREYTDALAEKYTVAALNAEILGFDFSTHEFELSDAQSGTYVDAEALYAEAAELLASGGGVIAVEIQEVKPEVGNEDISSEFGMITQALTNASSSSTNRLTNLTLACAAINGTVVQPGETFSFNDTVGERTKAKGYKKATVYQSGEVSEDIGGGVCQVSTTLWNAAMKADCEIVERHEHSRPVSYVDKGKDATVSWTSQDMKFKNTSDYPMYIVAYVSSNKRVYCEIYGKLLPDGMYIKIEAKTTKTISPGDPVMTYNSLLAKGQTVTVSEARTGYRAVAYRVYYSADGTELRRDQLCTSYYKEAAAKIEYG